MNHFQSTMGSSRNISSWKIFWLRVKYFWTRELLVLLLLVRNEICNISSEYMDRCFSDCVLRFFFRIAKLCCYLIKLSILWFTSSFLFKIEDSTMFIELKFYIILYINNCNEQLAQMIVIGRLLFISHSLQICGYYEVH